MNIISQYYQDIVDYFRSMAERHTALRHDEPDNHAFIRVSIQEAFLGYDRSKVKKDGYVMEMIDPTYTQRTADDGTQYKDIQGGFQIIGHHKSGDDLEQIRIMSEADKIADDIIQLMRFHSRGSHPIFDRSLDITESVNTNFVINQRDGNYAGVRKIFNFSKAHPFCVYRSNWIHDIDNDPYIQEDDLNCIK